MKTELELFKDVGVVFLHESVNLTDFKGLIQMTTKLAEMGIKQIFVDFGTAQMDTEATQLLNSVKGKMKNSKTPQTLFVGQTEMSLGDFPNVLAGVERFPTAEGIKLKDLLPLREELIKIKTKLDSIAGVLQMPGGFSDKEKDLKRKQVYLNKVDPHLDSEITWLTNEIKAAGKVATAHPLTIAETRPEEMNLNAYFKKVLES